MYADDTQLAVIGPRNRLEEMTKCMEIVFDRMITWFLPHGMKVSASELN